MLWLSDRSDQCLVRCKCEIEFRSGFHDFLEKCRAYGSVDILPFLYNIVFGETGSLPLFSDGLLCFVTRKIISNIQQIIEFRCSVHTSSIGPNNPCFVQIRISEFHFSSHWGDIRHYIRQKWVIMLEHFALLVINKWTKWLIVGRFVHDNSSEIDSKRCEEKTIGFFRDIVSQNCEISPEIFSRLISPKEGFIPSRVGNWLFQLIDKDVLFLDSLGNLAKANGSIVLPSTDLVFWNTWRNRDEPEEESHLKSWMIYLQGCSFETFDPQIENRDVRWSAAWVSENVRSEVISLLEKMTSMHEDRKSTIHK
jgi:hypothetical protein